MYNMTEKLSSESTHDTTSTAPSGRDWSILTKISRRYDAAERSRVDTYKQKILDPNDFDTIEYRYEKIDEKPSLMRKVGRLAMDAVGIHPRDSIKRREREAMSTAMNEVDAKVAEETRRQEEEQAAREAERERRRAEEQAEAARKDQAAFEAEMAEVMQTSARARSDRFREQRIQESAERILNARLLTIDQLDDEILAENPEVGKRTIEQDGITVPVYDLKGLPFTMLTHAVTYRSSDNAGNQNRTASENLVKDPSLWAQRQDEAEKTADYGAGKRRGNTISTSYTNSERNLTSRAFNERRPSETLTYGFSHVAATSILSVTNGDGATPKNIGRDYDSSVEDPDPLATLEGPAGTAMYNEVLLRRYSETGEPKSPDYIVTRNGCITADMIRHAHYFGIPIINIEQDIYEERQRQIGKAILDSISPSDSYEEQDAKISELITMSEFKYAYPLRYGEPPVDPVGAPLQKPYANKHHPLRERCIEVNELEIPKRLDFLAHKLEETTTALTEAVRDGGTISTEPAGIADFQIRIIKNENPGHCNSIEITFRLKDSRRLVKTKIYDGARVNFPLDGTGLTKENCDAGDSTRYDQFLPIIEAYFAARDEYNQSLATQKNGRGGKT